MTAPLRRKLRDCRKIGGVSARGHSVRLFWVGWRVAWIIRLVKIGTEGEGACTDVMQINRPDDLGDIADLGLTLAKRSGCWPTSNRRWSPRKPGTTPLDARIAHAAAAFAG